MADTMAEQGVGYLWLDATGLESFGERFPTVAASLAAAGLDPAVDWLPIAPAAHYLSGGIVTDLDGASAMPGLWAVGEVACTGVHGANRLASNSLLEGMVFGARLAEAIGSGRDGPEETGVMRALLGAPGVAGEIACVEVDSGVDSGVDGGVDSGVDAPTEPARRRPLSAVAGDGGSSADIDVAKLRERLQRAMIDGAGVLRSPESLRGAAREVGAVARQLGTGMAGVRRGWPGRAGRAGELANLVTVSGALLRAAYVREETRGAHAAARLPRGASAVAVSARPSGRGQAGGASSAPEDPVVTPRLSDSDSDSDTATDAVAAGRRGCGRRPVGSILPSTWSTSAVARAIAEDVGPRGDLTALLVPESEDGRARVVARADGVLAGRLCALETFSQIDPDHRGGLADPRRWVVVGGVGGGRGVGPDAVDPHRRAHRAQFPLSPVGDRHHDSPVRRRRQRRQPRHAGARHEKDDAGAPGPREGGGAGRRRVEPPSRVVRRRAREGQPSGSARDHRRRGAARERWPGRVVEVECDRPDQVVEAVDAGRLGRAPRQHDAVDGVGMRGAGAGARRAGCACSSRPRAV